MDHPSIYNQKKWTISPSFITLIIGIGCFYFASLPLNFQGGDTPELVANAFSLFVPHPPGYPLWIWIQHFWIHYFPGLNIFWKASLLNSLFSLLTLFLIGYSIRKSTLKLLLVFSTLAFSKAFAEAAVLPDVFSLHGLICALIGFVFFFVPADSKLTIIFIPLLFAVGITHHHTIIFLTPVYLSVFYGVRSDRKNLNLFLASSFLGAFLVFLIYSSLLLLHPHHPFSWSNLLGLKTLWNHFIRNDYGSFQLNPQLDNFYNLKPLKFFFSEFTSSFYGLLVLLTWSLIQKPSLLKDTRLQIWALTMGFYILFILNLNVEPKAMGAEVLERFHLMPFIQFTVLCCYVLRDFDFNRLQRTLGICFVFLYLIISSSQIFQIFKLHKDSIFQDYAINLLRQSARYPNSIIFIENDNAFFGMRYAQTVLNQYKSVQVIQIPMVFYPWYREKFKQQVPPIQISNQERIQKTKLIDLEKDLITPNLEKGFSIILTNGFQDGKNFHVTFQGLGRRLTLGKGVSYDEKSLTELNFRTQLKSVALGAQANSRNFLFGQYAYYYLSKGLSSFNKDDFQGALLSWNSALNQVPFAFPALSNLCKILKNSDPRCSPELLKSQKEISGEYF